MCPGHMHVPGAQCAPCNTREMCFVCPACDIGDSELAHFAKRVGDPECTTGWLHGRQLSLREGVCECWESDPYANDPSKSMGERRFFHYRAIALILGAKGAGMRVKLPACVHAKISELYGDRGAQRTQVGFRSE